MCRVWARASGHQSAEGGNHRGQRYIQSLAAESHSGVWAADRIIYEWVEHGRYCTIRIYLHDVVLIVRYNTVLYSTLVGVGTIGR